MKQFLNDMLSAIVFLVLYLTTGNIVLAASAAIAMGVLQIVWLMLRRQKIDPMKWMSLTLVIVFGGATLYFDDPRFFMVKPSLGHFAVGFLMLRRGWIGRYLPSLAQAHLPQRMVDGWGYAWATLMFFLGAMNIFIAINFSAEIWGFYIVFVAMGAKLAMFALQYWVFRRATIRRKAAAEASVGQEI